MANHQEIDLEKLVAKVFKGNPESPNKYPIFLDTYDLRGGFEMLLTILVEGMKIKYQTDRINMSLLGVEDFNIISKHINSIGIKLNLDKYTIEEWELLKSNFKAYNEIIINNSTKLKDLKVCLLGGDHYYKISFDIL